MIGIPLNGGLNPWREFERLQDQLQRVYGLIPGAAEAEFPTINLFRDDDHLAVVTELPGVDPENLEVTVHAQTLTIRGARKEEGHGDTSYHRRERWEGQFSRTIELPFEVDADKVEAKLKNGVLSVHLTRAEREKPKQISVKVS